MHIVTKRGRGQAVVSWAAAVFLLGLILSLSGALPSSGALDLLSVGAAAGLLVVVTLVHNEVRERSPWATVALVLGACGLTLVLAGDAFQHVVFSASPGDAIDTATLWAATDAMRDWLGNGLLYASLLLLGGLLVDEGLRVAGALAVLNGLLGYLDLAFASAIGFPPHTNFLVVVVWEVILGFHWWRLRSHANDVVVDRKRIADGRKAQHGGVAGL
jgi:hypothetical protein